MPLNLARTQFRVLYREFLFRMVDLELLSSRADMNQLLSQLAAMIAALSSTLALGAPRYSSSRLTGPERLIGVWTIEHFLIAITMLVVGLIAVLCWDSTFPDRRDALVLAPLPVRTRTLFLAKLAALGTALSLTVATANVFTGLAYPWVLAPEGIGVPGFILSLAAYWLTMLAAGAFIFCSVLCVQGLAALLPRRLFLRLSAFLQLGAFCLFLSVFFLEPSLATPKALTAQENQRMLAWLPSYWFLGLFQALNGSMRPALAPLARRALTGLAIAGSGAAVAFLLSYLRTLRKIVEEPDILPGSHGASWLPAFGDSLQTGIVRFTIRTLLRSRQHRVILAFYLGLGFAIALAYLKSLARREGLYQANIPLLISTLVMMCFAVIGVRVVFSMPLALRANWIFRVTMVRGAPEYLAAIRRSLLVLAAAPVWTASAVLFLSVWPIQEAAGHLIVLGLVGLILTDFSLHNFQKIPFTCSYLPGKANVHITSGAYMVVLVAITDLGVRLELSALHSLADYAKIVTVLGIAAIWAWRRTAAQAKSQAAALQFEEMPPADIFALELHRDGAMPG
jgi:hypothetical protein